ncbi:glucan endo-1,3-beta-glucosidase-like [Tasmannia lanceolata]|uniref:glucan endo-1,3-beta-glucosidase-like n=1 Tax=Tasmannia lanceolata TaxID=3420 RepID=UPI004063FA59
MNETKSEPIWPLSHAVADLRNAFFYGPSQIPYIDDNDDDNFAVPALSFVYGNERSRAIDPQDTVKHCQINNITKSDLDVLDALRDTHLKVIVPVANNLIDSFAKNPKEAALWVENFILKYWSNVKFLYICVGQDALLLDESESLFAAMTNINDAIQQDPNTKGNIKVSTTIGISDLDKYDVMKPPSQFIFNSSIKGFLIPILDFLISNDARLFVNVYPYEYFPQHRKSKAGYHSLPLHCHNPYIN